MNRELIINSTPVGADIALLEDKRLVELHREKLNSEFNVGDIMVGRVKKIIPGLNAAFVDVGYERDAFLHYTDLGPNIRSLSKYTTRALAGNQQSSLLADFQMQPEIDKGGKIKDVLKPGYSLLVQVLKEPISTKGPRLSCEITIPGRYIILAPFTNTVGVSKKIGSADERKRLERLMDSIKPKQFGIVVRTVAEGKSVSALHEDMQNLLAKWDAILKNLKGANPPQKVHSELSKTSTILRDLLNASFNRIVVNDKPMAQEIETFVKRIAPDKQDIVSYYSSTTRQLFDSAGITKQIKSLFGKTVTIPGGAYLVIEHTEALHVIDVNSGHKMSMEGDQQSTALSVNLEAASEIARQLRLRDLGGIIIIDFIDLKNPAHKKQLYERMKDVMADDRAKNTVLPLTKFGIMQITRQRVRPELNIATTEVCPTCRGTGKIEASILVVDEIEETLKFLLPGHKKIKLHVHPFIEAYLKRGFWFNSPQVRWFLKNRRWIPIFPDNNFQLTEYHFYNGDEEEIDVK